MKHFKVFPDGGAAYFEVHIWPNRRVMRRESKIEDIEACCRTYRVVNISKDGKFTTLPALGAVHFYGKPGVGIITHELTHAASGYMRWRRAKRVKNHLPSYANKEMGRVTQYEEIFCWVIGNLMAQFCWSWYGRKSKFVGTKPPFEKVKP